MDYTVGSHIDLSDLNDAPATPRRTPRENYEVFLAGTRIRFWEVTRDFVIMGIREPAAVIFA